MMNHMAAGLALAFQFFSVIPVKKELPMEKRDITAMYMAVPLVGVLIGMSAMAIAFLLRDYTGASPLLGAFILTIFFLAATGGLHLDGLADTADAYFSYQDRARRLEIMGDPRIGAFGTMALVLAVTGKVILIAEVFSDLPLLWLLVVPTLSRIGLLVLFSGTHSAKKDGLAAFFQQRAHHHWIAATAGIYLLGAASLLVLAGGWLLGLVAMSAFLLMLFVYRRWCLQTFGGVTGDLFGAYVEGAELLLWTVFLFFI